VDGGRITLRALVTDVEGCERVEDTRTRAVAEAAQLGAEVAEQLLATGAGRLLGR
jgi:porphobilinogen deaminase